MINNENCSEIMTLKNSGNKEIFKEFSKDEYSTQLNECLSKKSINKDNNIDNIDNISEINVLGNKSKQNCSKTNNQKMNENENDSFWELNTSNNNINKYEQIFTDFDTIKNNNYLININKEMILETENDINNTIKITNNCLGAKKKLFKVIYPENFVIFNRGNFQSYLRKFINQILNIGNTKMLFINKNIISPEKKEGRIKRKNNADNIRKKIKTRFLKNLKNSINEKLKLAGSKYLFNLLPQTFICNITKEKNRILLDLTFKELFSKNFGEKEKTDANLKKYEDNLLVLNYLESNKEISEKSKYNLFKNMKYYEIFDEYFWSKEFEMEIERLRKKEDNIYIRHYIKLAKNFIDFFYQ